MDSAGSDWDPAGESKEIETEVIATSFVHRRSMTGNDPQAYSLAPFYDYDTSAQNDAGTLRTQIFDFVSSCGSINDFSIDRHPFHLQDYFTWGEQYPGEAKREVGGSMDGNRPRPRENSPSGDSARTQVGRRAD